MNERIKELANKAKKSVPQNTFTPDKWIEVYNERFAELIISECIESFRNGECVRKHFNMENENGGN